MVTKTSSDKAKSETVEAVAKKASGSFAKKLLITVVVAGAVCGGGWYLYKNPELLQFANDDSVEKALIVQLEGRINALQKEINELKTVTAEVKNDSLRLAGVLNGKIDNANKINAEILDSRASNGALLGVVSRVDALESKVRSFGQVSTRGALILTAAMLVKDSASAGNPFVYEAEVLRNLATGTNMEAPAEVIASFSNDGLPSSEVLIERFNELYIAQKAKQLPKEIAAEQEAETVKDLQKEADWKEKINSKLSKLISIEYHEKPIGELVEKDEVYRLVNEGKFSEASVLMSTKPEYATEAFAEWQKQITATEDFNRALSQIEALTLAVMKAENLTNNN